MRHRVDNEDGSESVNHLCGSLQEHDVADTQLPITILLPRT